MRHEEGATRPKMISIGMHYRIIGHPASAVALPRLRHEKAQYLDHTPPRYRTAMGRDASLFGRGSERIDLIERTVKRHALSADKTPLGDPARPRQGRANRFKHASL